MVVVRDHMVKFVIYLVAALMLGVQILPAMGQYPNVTVNPQLTVDVGIGDPQNWITPIILHSIINGSKDLVHFYKAKAYSSKAYSSDSQGLYDLALDNINKSIEEYGKMKDLRILFNHSESGTWDIKGNIFLGLKQDGNAIASFDQAINIDPNNAYPWNDKGCALYDLGSFNDAIKCYENAMYLDPSLTIAFYNKRIAQQKLNGNYQQPSNPIQLPQLPQLPNNCKYVNTPQGLRYQCAGSTGSTGWGMGLSGHNSILYLPDFMLA